MSEEEEYKVEKILKIRGSGKKREVYVKWANYDPSFNTWEPLSGLEDTVAWEEFQEEKNPKKRKKKRESSTRKKCKKNKKAAKIKNSEVIEILEERKTGKKTEFFVLYKQGKEKKWEDVGKIKHLQAYKKFLQSQEETPEDQLSDGEAEEYIVEEILDQQKIDGKMRFKVKWKGYSKEHDSWEPTSGVSHTFAYEKWIAKSKAKRKRKSSSDKQPKKRKRKKVQEEEELPEYEDVYEEEEESEEEEDGYDPAEEDGGEEESEEEDDEDEKVNLDELNEKMESLEDDSMLEEEVDSEPLADDEEPPKKKRGKKKSRKKGGTADHDELEEGEFRKIHGNPYGNGPCIWFDPQQLSDDEGGDSDDEDERVTDLAKEFPGRDKAYRGKEKTARKITSIIEKRKKNGTEQFLCQWHDMRPGHDNTWEPIHKVKHTIKWLKFKTKQAESKGNWSRSEDRLLSKLTKRDDYKKQRGGFDIYRFCMRLGRSDIAVRNRLKRLDFIESKKRVKKKKKKVSKPKASLSEKSSRESDDYTLVDNNFVSSASIEVSESAKKMLEALKVNPASTEKLKLEVEKSQLDGHDIVLIVGDTGSGKTTLLKTFGGLFVPPKWNPKKAVISEIPDVDRAMECLSSVGFMSIPSWLKPYHVLSQGEAYRVLLSMTIFKCTQKKGSWVLLDDFTNNLDRVAARSCASSLASAVRRRNDKGELAMGNDVKYVLATSNYDIIPFLQPSLVIELKDGKVSFHCNPNEKKKLKVKALVDLREQPIKAKDKKEIQMPEEPKGDLEIVSMKDCSKGDVHVLKTKIQRDDNTSKAESVFDHPFTGEIQFQVPPFPENAAKEDFEVGFISGASGTGKTSTAWTYFGEPFVQQFEANKCVIEYFEDLKMAEELFELLGIEKEDLRKPFDALSNGTKERINIAVGLQQNREKPVVFDEFTSCQDRISAMRIAQGVCKFCRKHSRKCVLVACHSDLLHSEGLVPDWWFSTQTFLFKKMKTPKKSSAARSQAPSMFDTIDFTVPEIHVRLIQVHYKSWEYFKQHHYKDDTIRSMAVCYSAWAEFQNLPIKEKCLVAWCSLTVGQKTTGDQANTPRREHRTVVFPDWQGLGFASRICDAAAQILHMNKSRVASKTAHPRYGSYRDKSPLWKGSPDNHRIQKHAVNHKDPFKTKGEREKNLEWQRLKANYKPKKYYDHYYVGREANEEYFDNRVIFIDYEGKSLDGKKYVKPKPRLGSKEPLTGKQGDKDDEDKAALSADDALKDKAVENEQEKDEVEEKVG